MKVEVFSAYKQGFFGSPNTSFRPCGEAGRQADDPVRGREAGDRGKPKRFYTESARWLQELYPVDEIAVRDLGLPAEPFNSK